MKWVTLGTECRNSGGGGKTHLVFYIKYSFPWSSRLNIALLVFRNAMLCFTEDEMQNSLFLVFCNDAFICLDTS